MVRPAAGHTPPSPASHSTLTTHHGAQYLVMVVSHYLLLLLCHTVHPHTRYFVDASNHEEKKKDLVTMWPGSGGVGVFVWVVPET